MSWRGIVLTVMRVPHEPEPPPGSPSRTFRAAPSYLTLRIAQWIFMQIVLLPIPVLVTALVLAVKATDALPVVKVLMEVLQGLAWTIYLAQLLSTWMVLRLNFELRWYMLSDRAIRIREGIATVREKTMTLANIQNIAVRQGPLQRLLGIADVEVKTAGGGGPGQGHGKPGNIGEPMHVAYFRGVDNAEEIRALLREGVRRQKDAGLGDPDDRHYPPMARAAEKSSTSDLTQAVTALLREARALHAVVKSRP